MDAKSLSESPMYLELCNAVLQEVARLESEQPDRAAALESQRKQLEAEQTGRLRSLSKADLSAIVRSALEQEFEKAQLQVQAITARLTSLESAKRQVQESLDPDIVAAELNKLHDTMARTNPSATNMMLSQHIEGIWCRRDGTVVVRTCKLGALTGALDVVRSKNAKPLPATRQEVCHEAKPRRRTKLNVGAEFEDDEEVENANFFATDPDRFADLGPEWFWEDAFELPPREPGWAEANSDKVAAKRAEGLTHAGLVEFFGKTAPTIRKALKFAKAKNPDLAELPLKMPRARWEEQNYQAVADAKREHPEWKMKEFVEYFGKCETLISRAFKLANKSANHRDSDNAVDGAIESSGRAAI